MSNIVTFNVDPPSEEAVDPPLPALASLDEKREQKLLPTDLIDEIISQVAEDYLNRIDPEITGQPIPSPAVIKSELVRLTNLQLGLRNLALTGPDRFTMLKALTANQVGRILCRLHKVIRIAPVGRAADEDAPLIGVYQWTGPGEGTYTTTEASIRRLARTYNQDFMPRSLADVIAWIKDQAPELTQNSDKDLIALGNGIFHYKTKQLLPFDPKHVFLTKVPHILDFDAQSPVIKNEKDGTTWEIEQWMEELTDDEGVSELFWQIGGAIVRPHVPWGRFAAFTSEKGNNGKGTLCAMYRGLSGNSASIPVDKFGQDFMLEELLRANCIIVDENEVDCYLDKAAAFKAVVTQDLIQLNRKNKAVITVQFWGFMVQCLNGVLKSKDKSDSFYRRPIYIPFRKTYEGVERRYIKHDYLQRPDVLRYVLKRVLLDTPDYYELTVPEACVEASVEQKILNDPVREFWAEFGSQFTWDVLPNSFLHRGYTAWMKDANPSGQPISQAALMRRLQDVVGSDWTFAQFGVTLANMGANEPLLNEWSLGLASTWRSKAKYRGFKRVAPAAATSPATLAEAQAQADGFTAHSIAIGSKNLGWVDFDLAGRPFLQTGGDPDMSLWDPVSSTYNGQPERALSQVDRRFLSR